MPLSARSLSRELYKGIRIMKRFLFLTMLTALLSMGCAHSPYHASFIDPSTPPTSEQLPQKSPDMSMKFASVTISDGGNIESGESTDNDKKNLDDAWENIEDADDYLDETQVKEEEAVTIADPLEPFNRAMYHFNDKLYFWVLKPVAQGYNKVVPEAARVSVSNFFSNITFPIRFVNCLLQVNVDGAARELGRFMVNTVFGIGGLLDPASRKDANLEKQDNDFGQTLGFYGVGQGFYIMLPILGPSSPRDTVGLFGDSFLQPVNYINPWEAVAGIRVYDKLNDTSLKIGDYESLKEAAIDPYVAIRDVYAQYRHKKIQKKRGTPDTTKPGTVDPAPITDKSPMFYPHTRIP